ncbi:MAG: type VI secretion system-associated FHA domain protein TagH [endosymbiont of Galathealinum brachiosum]|uniref:Type VI secretion system-associated FHA domain protein TagH n=1 Tax=endosymbiont of Galathealinum brachiosum TaxID=2200906 RepID=A0A370DFZ7_9GAMM|nr:MAG: type VI secretion system-associated FHA domain protein TagH [endosymbiont of Galathealinum brachiosum]
MPLIVTINRAPESVNLAETTKTFDEAGGSLGRAKDNNWVLDDPERFLSSCHCQLSCENGQFYLTDLSTNGTFFNGAVNPMGKGTRLPINDGDSFELGDYSFSANVAGAAQQDFGASADPFASSASSASGNSMDDIFSSAPQESSFGQNDANPFGGGHVSSADSLFTANPEETDPLAALDKAQGGSIGSSIPGDTNDPFKGGLDGLGGGDSFASQPASDPFGGPSHSDQSDLLNQQVSWPEATPDNQLSGAPSTGGGIPDDWDDDFMSSEPAAPAAQNVTPQIKPSTPLTEPPVVPKPAQPQAPAKPVAPVTVADEPVAQHHLTGKFDTPANEVLLAQQQAQAKLQSELEVLKQQMISQQKGIPSNVTVDTTLINAMGLHQLNMNDEEITRVNQVVGEVVREMVSGLMQVLGSRSSIKNEFRMNVTTIQPVENNPLKFSANIDDALENMFIKQGNAYKKPVEAVQESFESIAEHQVAILAGIRAAFKGVIERFDPVLLEQRFAKQKKSGLMPASQKAKNWDAYLEYYNELAGDIDSSFQYLFGDEFVQAYEEQLQKLTIARKSQKNKT